MTTDLEIRRRRFDAFSLAIGRLTEWKRGNIHAPIREVHAEFEQIVPLVDGVQLRQVIAGRLVDLLIKTDKEWPHLHAQAVSVLNSAKMDSEYSGGVREFEGNDSTPFVLRHILSGAEALDSIDERLEADPARRWALGRAVYAYAAARSSLYWEHRHPGGYEAEVLANIRLEAEHDPEVRALLLADFGRLQYERLASEVYRQIGRDVWTSIASDLRPLMGIDG